MAMPKRRGDKVIGGVDVPASVQHFKDRDCIAAILKLPPSVMKQLPPKGGQRRTLAAQEWLHVKGMYLKKTGRVDLIIFLPRFKKGSSFPPGLPGMPPISPP